MQPAHRAIRAVNWKVANQMRHTLRECVQHAHTLVDFSDIDELMMEKVSNPLMLEVWQWQDGREQGQPHDVA